MKIILTDSSFLISSVYEGEPFYRQSVFINEAISNLKMKQEFLFPQLFFSKLFLN